MSVTRGILAPHRHPFPLFVLVAVCFLWEGAVQMLAPQATLDRVEWIETFHWPRDVLVAAVAVLCGAVRATALHPVYRMDYRKSLLLTPWTADKPLPAGPLIIGWVDGIIAVVLMVLVAYRPNFAAWRIPLFLLVGYVVPLCLPFHAAGLRVHSYAVLFGLALLVRVWHSGIAAASTAVVIVLISISGIRHTLRQMRELGHEFDDAGWMKHFAAMYDRDLQQKQKKKLGWIFELLQPQKPTPAIGWAHGVVVSLLLGWWVYAVFAVGVQLHTAREMGSSAPTVQPIEQPGSPASSAAGVIRNAIIWSGTERAGQDATFAGAWILVICAFLCSLLRLCTYRVGHRSPINLWGRVRTRRWIVPSYDRVFLAPLCVVLALIASTLATSQWSLNPIMTVPVTATLMLLIALNMGPSLADWQLTSACRLALPLDIKNRQFVEA